MTVKELIGELNKLPESLVAAIELPDEPDRVIITSVGLEVLNSETMEEIEDFDDFHEDQIEEFCVIS